ncbi:MAG: T9SS type A sorting domain-containing protein [Candidatus Kapabacteria bacterium]|nr:T9SS type A sorting domain-containing protein [Candidatus Kapabacteria bacterium]
MPNKLNAQLYFFDGFTDAAVPSSWYTTPQALGAGFGGANFAGQNMIVLGGRHAVVNGTMLLNGGTITVQSGGQLTVVGTIAGGGNVTVNAGGTLRIDGAANLGVGLIVNYNLGSTLYFSGTTARSPGVTELPGAGVAANVIFHNTATTGITLTGFIGLPFNGQVTVSSSTLRVDNSTLNMNSTFAFQSNGVCELINGTPGITFNSSVDVVNGTFLANTGVGSLTFSGTGALTGGLRVTTGGSTATALNNLTISRSGAFSLGSSFGINNLTVNAVGAALTVSQGQTKTVYSNFQTIAGTSLAIQGTVIYTGGFGAVNLNGTTTVSGVLQVEAAAFGGTGTISIQDGGRLRTQFTLNPNSPVQYSSPNATLEYFGTNTILPNAPPSTELNTTMDGSIVVSMSGAGQVRLNGNYTIRGNLSIAPASAANQPVLGLLSNSSLTLKGNVITQSGVPTLGVADPDEGTVSITLDSTSTTPITNFVLRPLTTNTGSGLVRNFTYNRPSTLTLAGNLLIGPESAFPNVITPTLNLRRGIIIPSVGNRVILLSSNATSLVGGSTSAYIQGVFQRSLRTSASSYFYPVGTGNQYMPITIINPVTAEPIADATPGVSITPQAGVAPGTSGTLGQIASFAQNGRVWTANLTTLTGVASFRVQLQDTNLVSSNVIALADNVSRDFRILPGILQGTQILTSTMPVGLPMMQSSLIFRIGNTTPAPNITAISPVIAGSGATILISGTNFLNVTRVGIGTTTAASYSVLSPTQIAAVLPASVVNDAGGGNAVRVNLNVTAQGGSTASVTTLTFVLPPTAISFTPTIGTPGTPVRIIGSRLGGTLYNEPPLVFFGGVPAQSVIVNSPTDITAFVPRNGTTGTIRISTPGGTTATLSTFTFVPPPRISEIVPSIAPERAIVTVNGTGFIQIFQARVGGVQTAFTQNSANRVSLLISTGATGVVELFTPAGIITSATIFTFAPPPRINLASPLIVGTGANIRLDGFGFVGIPTVEFGSVTAQSVSVATLTAMNVTVPINLSPGRYPITVSTPGGTTTSTFQITVVPAPIVTAFSPSSGTTGTVVEIRGRNFLASTVSNVRISGVTAANFRVVSDSLIIAESARISTDGTISVTALGGTSIGPGVFLNIAPPPAITGFQPIAATTGTLVTVFGNNFNDANVLQIVNDDAILTLQGFRVVTNGQLTFVMPPNATSGTLVIGTSGGFARSSSPITYLPPPSIFNVEPSFGQPGTTFVITGQNLTGTREVLIGAGSAIRVRQDSPNQLTVQIDSSARLGFDLPITIQAEQGTTRVNNIFSIVTDVQADSLALVETYRRTVGSGWRQNANWLTLRPIAEWIGVSTATSSADSTIRGRVIGLSLPQNNIQGTLPQALRFLTQLRTLNLSGNPLVGAFPQYIANYRRLETLNFSGMRLSGPLNDSIGALRNLAVFNLSNNTLSGIIPRALQNTSLRELNLSGNLLTDSVPAFLGSMSALRVLRLNTNRLSGTIPASLGNLANLQEFDISQNNLTGIFPDTLRSLRNISVFAASNNQFTGAVPMQILRSFENLRTLNLGNNQFTGTIPPELALQRRLRFLSLKNNLLSGNIPDNLSSLDSLEVLLLDSNTFSGALPASFENFSALTRLSIAGNQITVLPNLLRIRPLNNLNVASNKLDFGSIEPNALIDTLSIVPQDSIGDARRIGGIVSIPVRLSVNTPGTANRYQWFRQTPQGEIPVSAVLRDSSFIFAFTAASSGTYTCRVTNTLPELRGLTLFTRPIRIDSVGVPSMPREVPEPLFPLDSITNITTTASLSWTRTTDASIYDVQLVTGRDTLNVSVADTAFRLPGVRFETLYNWRVRGRNITGFTAWSVWNPFVTVARNVEIAAVIARFPRTPVSDEVRQDLTLISNTTATIFIQSLVVNDNESNFEPVSEIGANFPLQPGANIPVQIKFVPKTSGRKIASVTIRYRTVAGGEIKTLLLPNIIQGDATPLKVVDTDFDLVRVNRRTLAAVSLINRLPRSTSATGGANTNVITITGVEIESTPRNIFVPIAFQSPMYLGPGDTTALIIRCQPTTSGRLTGRIRVVGSFVPVGSTAPARDSSFGNLRANAVIAQPASDYFVEIALRPIRGQERAVPGARVNLQIYYTNARFPDSTNLADVRNLPSFQSMFGSLRFDRNVLSLMTNNVAENQPNSAPLNTISRSILFSSVPLSFFSRDGRHPLRRDSVLVDSIPCRVVAGTVTETPVLLEQLTWGRLGNRALKIFVEEAPTTSTFTATASRAGGTRLIAPAAPGLVLNALQPNPANNEMLVSFKTSANETIALEVLDMQGQVLKTIALGELSLGEHSSKIQTSGLPSGSYILRIKSETSSTTQKFTVIH